MDGEFDIILSSISKAKHVTTMVHGWAMFFCGTFFQGSEKTGFQVIRGLNVHDSTIKEQITSGNNSSRIYKQA